MVAAVSAERLREVCGSEPGWPCERVLDLTDSKALADIAEWAVEKPLTILLILLGTFVVSRLARHWVGSSVRRIATGSVQRRVDAATGLASALREGAESAARSNQRIEAIVIVLESITVYVAYVIGLLLVLGELGINLAPLLAGAGVVGLAIGFGAQSLVKDFFSGLFILLEDQYAVGDIVDVGEASGVVENVSLRTTRLRSVDGVVWHVPNGEILRVGNMSQHWSRSLLDIEVAYDSDLAKVKEVIGRVASDYAAEDDDVLEEPDVWGVEALGASGITIRLVVKTRPSEQWRISRELRERIKGALDEAGIEIPFPTQTLIMRPTPAAE